MPSKTQAQANLDCANGALYINLYLLSGTSVPPTFTYVLGTWNWGPGLRAGGGGPRAGGRGLRAGV